MLGVSDHEVRRLLAAGDLPGSRLAGRWVLPVDGVRRWKRRPRSSGRPFSPSSSWAVLRLIEGEALDDGLSASRRWQLRQHLDHDPHDLAAKLRRRADRRSCRAHSSVLVDLEQLLLRSGVSAVEDVGADLIVRDRVVEGYVSERDVKQLEVEFRLRDVDDYNANVVLHVVPAEIDLPFRGHAPVGVVALDLIESGEPRAEDAGWRLWRDAVASAAG